MDKQNRKKLIQEYKNRKVDMGIIQFMNTSTEERFVAISKNVEADINSHRFKLKANWHPNKELQTLWNELGEEGFEMSVIEELDYDETMTNHTALLEEIIEIQLAMHSNMKRMDK